MILSHKITRNQTSAENTCVENKCLKYYLDKDKISLKEIYIDKYNKSISNQKKLKDKSNCNKNCTAGETDNGP